MNNSIAKLITQYMSESENSDSESTDVPHYMGIVNKRRRIFTSSSESENDTDDLNDNLNPKKLIWKEENLDPVIHPFDDSNSGIKANINEHSSILNIFQIFFSNNMVEDIVKETNSYYGHVAGNQFSVHARPHNWSDTTVSEIYRFFAVTMLMSRVRKPTIGEYWSRDKIIKTESFGEIMARDRFLLILKMLHFYDNTILDTDPLIQIRSVLDKLKTSFRTAFSPYENLLLFKGKSYFKQYVPSKRTKFPIKSFVLYDCKTGYIQDLIVYSEKHMKINQDISTESIEKSRQILMTLLQPYLGKGHTLIIDNWYNSPSLFLDLYKNSTNAYGTIKKDRFGITDLKNEIKKEEYIFRSTETLLAMKWMGKREVWMISTCHSANIVETNKVHFTTQDKIKKPECINDYENMMAVVHKVDMIFNSINSTKKDLKWYKKYFFDLMDLAIYNTYILYKNVSGKSISFASFHLQLIKEILNEYNQIKNFCWKGKNVGNGPFRLTDRHFPCEYINEALKRNNAMRKCVVCWRRKRRRETHYQCKKCDVGLCIDPCFEVYHTVEDY